MNRRLPNPILDKGEFTPGPTGQLVMRVLLIAAAVVSLLLAALMYLPGETLLVHYWIYIVVMALPIVLLLAALVIKIYRSIRSRLPRLIVTWLSATAVFAIVVVVYSLSFVYTQVGANPVAYYTSPDTGNRLVIMRAVDLDNTDANMQTPSYFYGAFPMRNRLFYYPNRGDMIATKTGIDYVEWMNGGHDAAVHITDREGVEQVIDISFDFSKPVEMPEE